MFELSKEVLATKEVYNLLKDVIKNDYMPKSFEDFENSFVAPTQEDIEELKNNNQFESGKVRFAYIFGDEENKKFLALIFLYKGLAKMMGDAKEKLVSDESHLIDMFNFKYQKFLADKFNDLEYFEYLNRKNKYLLELFDEEIKKNKPKFGLFDRDAKKTYKQKIEKCRAELASAHAEHVAYIESRISELSK